MKEGENHQAVYFKYTNSVNYTLIKLKNIISFKKGAHRTTNY